MVDVADDTDVSRAARSRGYRDALTLHRGGRRAVAIKLAATDQPPAHARCADGELTYPSGLSRLWRVLCGQCRVGLPVSVEADAADSVALNYHRLGVVVR